MVTPSGPSSSSILQIDCIKDYSEIISYADEKDKEKKLEVIADRLASLYADYLTVGGHKKIHQALIDQGYLKDKSIVKQETALCFAELVAFKNTLQNAIVKEFNENEKFLSAYNSNTASVLTTITHRDFCQGPLGKTIDQLKLRQEHSLIQIAFFPSSRQTEITCNQEKKEFKVSIMTPKPTGINTWF